MIQIDIIPLLVITVIISLTFLMGLAIGILLGGLGAER